jgi:hypothetical protein
MAERVLVTPPWGFSPRALEAFPAGRAFLEDLRSLYRVEVFRWPVLVGDDRSAGDWRTIVSSIQSEFSSDCHLVCTGGASTSSLLALSNSPGAVHSLVAEGLVLPEATLRAVGLKSLAEVVRVLQPSDRSWSHQLTRLTMTNSSEEEIEETAHLIEEDIDWAKIDEASRSYNGVDLVEEGVRIDLPTLYLQGQMPLAGYEEMRDVFLRFVPHAQTGTLSKWPQELDDEESGHELARVTTAFLRENSYADPGETN